MALLDFVQSKSAHAISAPAPTFDSAVTNGSLIIVDILLDLDSATVSSVADNKTGNTYIQANRTVKSGFYAIETWYALNVNGGSSFTVTATGSSGGVAASIHEYLGDSTISFIAATGTDGVTSVSVNVNNASPAMAHGMGGSAASQPGAGSGYTRREAFVFDDFHSTEDKSASGSSVTVDFATNNAQTVIGTTYGVTAPSTVSTNPLIAQKAGMRRRTGAMVSRVNPPIVWNDLAPQTNSFFIFPNYSAFSPRQVGPTPLRFPQIRFFEQTGDQAPVTNTFFAFPNYSPGIPRQVGPVVLRFPQIRYFEQTGDQQAATNDFFVSPTYPNLPALQVGPAVLRMQHAHYYPQNNDLAPPTNDFFVYPNYPPGIARQVGPQVLRFQAIRYYPQNLEQAAPPAVLPNDFFVFPTYPNLPPLQVGPTPLRLQHSHYYPQNNDVAPPQNDFFVYPNYPSVVRQVGPTALRFYQVHYYPQNNDLAPTTNDFFVYPNYPPGTARQVGPSVLRFQARFYYPQNLELPPLPPVPPNDFFLFPTYSSRRPIGPVVLRLPRMRYWVDLGAADFLAPARNVATLLLLLQNVATRDLITSQSGTIVITVNQSGTVTITSNDSKTLNTITSGSGTITIISQNSGTI